MSYSVIMPSLPQEPFRAAALESIFGQTLQPTRVVVVLSGETRDEAADIREIKSMFPSVNVICCKTAGLPRALNAGLESVATPFVAFLDADDLWGPRKQELQITALRTKPELDAACCVVVNFQDDGRGGRLEGISATARLFTASTFRTDTFRRFGFFDSSIDNFSWLIRWWTQAAAQGIRTEAVEYRGLWRRIHTSNLWVKGNAEGHQAILTELRQINKVRRQGIAAEGNS